VHELKGEEAPLQVHSTLNLGLDVRIPSDYISDEHQRLRAYKKIADAGTKEATAETLAELEDRYGPAPEAVRSLLKFSALKSSAQKLGIEAIDRRHFRHRGDIRARDERLVARAGDDQHAHRRVMAHLANHARHFLEHLAIQRVERRRSVDGERRNRRFFKNYILEIHASSSTLSGFSVNP